MVCILLAIATALDAMMRFRTIAYVNGIVSDFALKMLTLRRWVFL